jgi:hypothetical protein
VSRRAPEPPDQLPCKDAAEIDVTRRRIAALLARGAVRAAAQGAGARVQSHGTGARLAPLPSGKNEETEFTES